MSENPHSMIMHTLGIQPLVYFSIRVSGRTKRIQLNHSWPEGTFNILRREGQILPGYDITQASSYQQTSGTDQKCTQISHSLHQSQNEEQHCLNWQQFKRGLLNCEGLEDQRKFSPDGGRTHRDRFPPSPVQDPSQEKKAGNQALSKALIITLALSNFKVHAPFQAGAAEMREQRACTTSATNPAYINLSTATALQALCVL